MKVQVKKSWAYAHDGIRIKHYVAGSVIETADKEFVDTGVKLGHLDVVAEKPADKKK